MMCPSVFCCNVTATTATYTYLPTLARHVALPTSVCDSSAGEACPIWPGQPISAHWGFEDPAAAQGSDEEKRRVFEKVFRQISTRIHVFISLPLAALDKAAIHRELKEIGASAPTLQHL